MRITPEPTAVIAKTNLFSSWKAIIRINLHLGGYVTNDASVSTAYSIIAMLICSIILSENLFTSSRFELGKQIVIGM